MKVLNRIVSNCAGLCAFIAEVLFNFPFRLLCHFLFLSLHQIYTWYSVILKRLHDFNSIKKLFRTKVKTDFILDRDVINDRIHCFEKIPQHLAIIVGIESPSFKDFVKTIVWSMHAGISHISFYDHHNGIDCKVLFENVCGEAKQYIPLIKWGKSFSEDIKEMSKAQINGYTWKPIITVHIYQRDDNFDIFMKSIPDIMKSGIAPLTVRELDTFLRKYLQAPDPDFAIICGQVFSYFGFPSWCLRVTQFQQLVSHHNLIVEDFLDLLEDFSNCKQRWGR